MSTLLGTHCPNRHFETNELSRMLAMGCKSYVIYVDWLPDAAYWVGVCQQIRTAQPAAKIHLRLERRGTLGNPTDEATQAAGTANLFVNLVNSYTFRNEPNIECDPGVTAAAWGSWLTTFLQQAKVRSLVPLWAPPVSIGARDGMAFLTATANAAKAAAVAGWHIHAYGNPDESETDIYKCRQLWPGPMTVTEHNFGAGRQYDLNKYIADMPEVCRRALKWNVESVNVFIWQWRAPDVSLPTTVNIRDTIVEPAMTAMAKEYGTVVPPPPPPPPPPGGMGMTEAEFERLVANIFFQAGVGYNPNGGFVKYFKAQWRAGRFIGFPQEQEHKSENQQYWLEAFAGAYLWSPVSDPANVKEGHPPFS